MVMDGLAELRADEEGARLARASRPSEGDEEAAWPPSAPLDNEDTKSTSAIVASSYTSCPPLQR